jgi:uncharacterized damage-inducible protein DinB
MLPAILDLWRTHDAVNRYMLDNIPAAGLETIPLLKNGQPGKGRNVARVFLHMYDVRVSHIPAALKREQLAGLPVFEKGEAPTRAQIEALLAGSHDAVAARLEWAVNSGEQINKAHPLTFLGYLICHESHHRGQIVLALKQNGFAPSEELRWGIWAKWFKP